MSKTLLEVTQGILSTMVSDNVNSIFDTEESETVARILVRVYEDMVANNDWASQRRLVTLDNYSDSSKPTHMLLPGKVKEFIFFNYDKSRAGATSSYYSEVKWKDPDAFLRYTNARNSANSNVVTVTDTSGVKLFILNDQPPTYFTSFDDNTIICDSYDATVSSTLISGKTQAMIEYLPTASLTDDWIIELPEEALPMFEYEGLSTVQWQVKEFQDIKAEGRARHASSNMSRDNWKIDGGLKTPNYGRRRGRTTAVDPTFRRN